MKRIALAPLLLAALTFAPAASADHGHNCIWSGGDWIGQGLCPGMPGYGDPHPTPTAEPTPTSTPTPTTPAPSPTSTPAPAPTTSTPTATSTPTSTSTPATPRPTSTTRCVWSGGQFIGQGDPRDCPTPALPRATASTATAPAPIVTGPPVEADEPYDHRNLIRGW